MYIKDGKLVASEKKDEFLDTFRLVSCKNTDFPALEQIYISKKEEDGDVTALLKKGDALKLGGDYKIAVPDLEQVMVYYERGKEDEELTI